MKIYDVTRTLTPGMLQYPGDPPITIETFKEIAKGDSSNISIYRFASHSGTHLDAPHHMLGNGVTLDTVSPQKLLGKARLFDLRNEKTLSREILEPLDFSGATHFLFKTDNSRMVERPERIDADAVCFDQSGAAFLAARKPVLVGIDSLSVDRFHSGNHPAHMEFLKEGVLILEGLDLSDVPEGDYTIFVGMLKIENSDGAPARVLLLDGLFE